MWRDRIAAYYGDECSVVALKRGLGANMFFVVDAVYRSRSLRTLGTIDREGTVLEQSAMDLLHPERLVFRYERMMLLALACVPSAQSILLLGVGGAAMYRHLSTFLPKVAVTAVERDPTVIQFAHDYFHLSRPVRRGDAETFVAEVEAEFDVVMVDLYDADGVIAVEDRFWRDCLAALRPRGCLAVNWASFADKPAVKDKADRLIRRTKGAFHLLERGVRPNGVSLAPRDPDFTLASFPQRVAQWVKAAKLPRENRDVLAQCSILRA